ncbi:MAG: sodium:proton antiporter [Streptosporangiales bacterium]|nr:sodium:proton antiporter [Streptosporangiales bacterium]
MTAVFSATLALLSLAGLCSLLRVVRGPSVLDRILALDVLLILLVSGIAVEAAQRGEPANIALLLVVSLLAFVGSVTAARFAGRRVP